MNTYHQSTVHTWQSVRTGTGLDWSLQPEVFKIYPQEYAAFPWGNLQALQEFLELSCGLTSEKKYPGGSYFLRTNPSAGALYPCELYLQARKVPGLRDGIYHVEPQNRQIRLLYALGEDEGMEGYWPQPGCVDGLIFLLSAIYYRSSWKYGHRALRYCLLDAGHLLGGIEAAACCQHRRCQMITRFKRQQVQTDFGFCTKELPLAMVACGELERKTVSRPAMHLPFVNGSGSFVQDSSIEKAFTTICDGPDSPDAGSPFSWPVEAAVLSAAIRQRRSIRSFSGRLIRQAEYNAVRTAALEASAMDCDETIDLYSVVHRVDGMESGIYLHDDCLRTGDFSTMAGYLCLEQALGADSGATLFLVSNSEKYLPSMLKAGLIGQRIYLAAGLMKMGCSGIGAFYDLEVAAFLETNGMVLYALAIGR